MAYQLVLQFRGESLENFSRLESLEEQIPDVLGVTETFDGLDVGGRGANIFVYTDNPNRTFGNIRALLRGAESAPGFMAACRTVAGERFRIIWPADATDAFSLR